MSDILALIGPGSGSLGKPNLGALGFAALGAERKGGAYDVALLGAGAGAWADEVSRRGARRVYVLEHPDLEPFTSEATARAVAGFLEEHEYRLVCAATSSATKEYFPRLAAMLEAPMGTDVLGIESLDAEVATFTRAVFVGNLLATVELQGASALVTCRPSGFAPPPMGDESAPTETVALSGPLTHSRKRHVALREETSDRPDLKESSTIVSVGRGTRGPEEGIRLCMELADVLNAALGASRAVVDAGWLPNELQVGQTGKIVAPALYIAVGLSGSIQHLAGMRHSKTIVAINNDPEAPIFEVAELRLVADLFEAVPELTHALREAKSNAS